MKRFCMMMLLVIAASAGGVFGRSMIKKNAADHFQIILDDSKDITFLQTTDLHLGKKGFWKQDLTTFRRIQRLVEEYNPDFIAVTGDLFTGEKYFGSLLAAFAVQFFDGLERPWIYVFGNHDPEGGFGRDDIYEVFSVSEWGILGFHNAQGDGDKSYDFQVDLLTPQSKFPAWEIYAFDSGSAQEKLIKKEQLAWYRGKSAASQKNAGRQIPAISLFHIPLKQYQDLWNDASIPKQGESREKVYFEKDDGSVYETFLQVGNIKATFCGHDHYNNFWGKYHGGIILAYGHISGEATNYAWPTGGKLVTLPTDGGEITMVNVAVEE